MQCDSSRVSAVDSAGTHESRHSNSVKIVKTAWETIKRKNGYGETL